MKNKTKRKIKDDSASHDIFWRDKKRPKNMLTIEEKVKPKIIKQNPENIAKNSNIEPELVKTLLDNFTQNSFELDERVKFVKTPVLQHKLIFHIIVLCLYLNNFKTDMGVLSKSMKIDNKQMFQYCRELGCNFPGMKNEVDDGKKVKNVKNLMFQLKAPLRTNIEKEVKRFTKKF